MKKRDSYGDEILRQLIKNEQDVITDKEPLGILKLMLRRTLNCPEFGNIMVDRTYAINELLLDTIAKAEGRDTLRLLLWEDCNRNCKGCCNKDINMSKIVTAYSFKGYSTIILTGGEPLLYPHFVLKAISMIMEQNKNARLLMYTSYFEDEAINALNDIMPYLDGITVTLHEQEDVEGFEKMRSRLKNVRNKSLRLNVFANVEFPIDIHFDSDNWRVKRIEKWIKNCPLPSNEVLKKMPYEF